MFVQSKTRTSIRSRCYLLTVAVIRNAIKSGYEGYRLVNSSLDRVVALVFTVMELLRNFSADVFNDTLVINLR